MAARRAWAFERGILWAMDLSAAASPHTSASIAVSPRIALTFTEVSSESAASLAAAMGLPHVEPVLRRFATRRRCFAGWLAEQIVVYGWLSQRDECVGELERVYQMRAGDAYIWNCETLPPYRGQGLYSALLNYIVDKLRREGVGCVWIGASLDNRPSLRGFASAGFQPIIKLAYLRLFNFSCLWMNSYRMASSDLISAARRMLLAAHERVWGPLMLGYTRTVQLTACAEIEG